MKKNKKILFMFINFVLALSVLSQSVFAAIGLYQGSESIKPSGSAVNCVTSDGNAGKMDSDTVYFVSGKEDSENGIFGVQHASKDNGLTHAIYEMSFMLPDETVKIRSHLTYYKSSTVSDYIPYAFLDINASNGITTRIRSKDKVAYWTLTNVNSYNIETNKWYTLAIDFPSEGNTTGHIYLNGVKVHTFQRNSNVDNKIYGVRNFIFGATEGTGFYLDNMYGYINETEHSFNIAESTPSLVTGGEGVTVENNVVTVPFGTTAQQLKNIITTTDGEDDVKRVYTNSEMTTEAQLTDLADGTTFVVAAKNGTGREMAYSYYTVQEAAPVDPDADVFKGNSADDLKFGDNAAAKDVNTQNGLFGKKEDDSAYKIVGSSKNQTIISLSRTLRDGSGTFARSKSGAIEFSFCLPEGSTGFVMTDCTGRTKAEGLDFGNVTELTVDSSGMYSADYCFYSNEIKTNTWYNFAVEIATDGTNKFKVYLNGEEVYVNNKNDINTWYGFRTFFININKNETLYLDNLSISESYNNALNLPANPTSENITLNNGKLTALRGTSVSDITLGENEAVRLYKADWSTAANLDEAAIAVIATTNGRSIERAYTYYNVDLKECITTYSKEDDILNANLKSASSSTLIIAWYTSDKTFVELTSDTAQLVDGIYVANLEDVNVNEDYSYRIFAWNSVDGLYPLTTSTDVK